MPLFLLEQGIPFYGVGIDSKVGTTHKNNIDGRKVSMNEEKKLREKMLWKLLKN